LTAFSSDVDLILRHPDISRDAEPSKMKEVLEAVVAELGDRVVDQTAFGPKIFRGLFRLVRPKSSCRPLLKDVD
jgi:hypothetical protein